MDKKYLCYVQDQGAVLEKVSDVACTLRARDYKGLDNFRSNAVIEVVGHYMPSGHNSSRVVNPKGIAPTVMGNNCTMRGRNPENPKSRKPSDVYVQKLEPNKQGICNTLTTVDKDNLVYEPEEYKVRRLTPKECGRLMGVQDQDIDKILGAVSNSQAYKQFGNSIVTNVMMECFKNLHIKEA